MAKRKLSADSEGSSEDVNLWKDSNELKFKPLGSGREVGRSCHVLEFKGKKIMLDCGIHPGRSGVNMLPYLDDTNLDQIDLLLVTHFHLDHAATLPYLMEHTAFRGQVYMTGSTKAVLRLVLKDYARILDNDPSGEKALYTQEDLDRCLDRCHTVGFHQVIEVEGVKITPYHAGHVLGAAMFLLEIAGVKILYTGDYSREDDRHLRGAEIPSIRPDVLIVEATFGLLVHESRELREKRFTESVEKIVRRGGNCLIPMGALGAVQELMLILEDHWNRNPTLKGIPIYHTSRIANEALNIYRSFINNMNAEMRAKQLSNPWSFENIGSLGEREEIVGPAVVLASPGYLQSGKSRKLFEQWCGEGRNGVILAGYSVEGTLAKDLSRSDLREVTSLTGTILPVNCEVKTITFAAHSDFIGTKSFVDQLRPKNVIFVHGEATQMSKLKNELQRNAKLANQEVDFFDPQNSHTVVLSFQEQRIVKAYGGELVQRKMRTPGSRVAAYLVRKDFTDRFISTEDIRLYTQLKTAAVKQKLHMPFHSKFEHLTTCVAKLFRTEPRSETAILVDGKIDLDLKASVVCMTWEASPTNDILADAIMAVLMQAEGGIPAVRVGTCCSAHAHGTVPEPVHVSDEPPADGTAAAAGDDAADDAVAPVAMTDVDETAAEPPSEAPAKVEGAPVAQVRENSKTAALFLRLLEERLGQDQVEVQSTVVRVSATRDVAADVRFTPEGHILSIEPRAPGQAGADLATDIQQLALLASQTLHPVL